MKIKSYMRFLIIFISIHTLMVRVVLAGSDQLIPLPEPRTIGVMSIEGVLNIRRSVRSFSDEAVALGDIAQLLWAGQGITSPEKFRTAPSAGGLYPLSLYVVAGNVAGLPAGVYKYLPHDHALLEIATGDVRNALCDAAMHQKWVRKAVVSLVIGGSYKRLSGRYGSRSPRYTHIESGCVAENILLQATALDLCSVLVGAFEDIELRSIIQMPREELPFAIIGIGKSVTR